MYDEGLSLRLYEEHLVADEAFVSGIEAHEPDVTAMNLAVLCFRPSSTATLL